jgi:hypothetical protein
MSGTELPYYLQKLPPEGLDMLRFMAQRGSAASVPEIESGAGLSNRMVLRTIRRLVNEGHVEVRGGLYALTGDGQAAAQHLAELEANQPPAARAEEQASAAPPWDVSAPDMGTAAPTAAVRRLAIVMPRQVLSGTSATLFFGVNAPEIGAPRLAGPARLELRMSAVGGNLSTFKVEIDIPPDRAAAPVRVSLIPAQAGRAVRVRVDAMHIGLDGAPQSLGGMYFDVHVPQDDSTYDPAPTAVGMDLQLMG